MRPRELWPPCDVVATANELADRSGARVTVSDDIATGVAGVDFVYTDVWVSMGEPREVWEQRVTLLRPYQVNADLMKRTGNPAAKFLHCLPAFHAPNTSVGTEIMNAVSCPTDSRSPTRSSSRPPASSSTKPRTGSTPSRPSSSPPWAELMGDSSAANVRLAWPKT